MGRTILSLLLGILSSFVVITALELVGFLIYPLPENFDKNNPESFKTFISSAPTIIFVLIILGYALGSFAGALVASSIAPKNKVKRAISIGGILMGFGIYNLVTIPHPLWVVIIAGLVFLPFAFLGGKLAEKLTSIKEN